MRGRDRPAGHVQLPPHGRVSRPRERALLRERDRHRALPGEEGPDVFVERDWVRAERPATRAASRFLRRLTRRLYDEKVFSVVLTPSYDKHHRNHPHLDGAAYTVDGT
jgi:hypothetical protein